MASNEAAFAETLRQIQNDPRVIQLAQSRGQFGGVTTAELRAFGYPVPDHTKYTLALPKGGKNWRATNNNGSPGFAYNDAPTLAGKIIALGAAGLATFGAASLFAGAGAAAAGAGSTSGTGTSALTLAPGFEAGLNAGLGGAAGTAGTAAGAATAAKKALSTYDIAKDVIKAAGAGVGDAADTMAHNRGVRMSAAAEAEALNVARRRDDRDSRADAWKAAQQAAYVGNRGTVAKGPGVAGPYSRNVNLPPIDPAIVAARRDEAAKRLQTPYQDFAFDPTDLNASGAEKAAGIGSTVAGVASAVPESVWKKIGRFFFVAFLVSSGLV